MQRVYGLQWLERVADCNKVREVDLFILEQPWFFFGGISLLRKQGSPAC